MIEEYNVSDIMSRAMKDKKIQSFTGTSKSLMLETGFITRIEKKKGCSNSFSFISFYFGLNFLPDPNTVSYFIRSLRHV